MAQPVERGADVGDLDGADEPEPGSRSPSAEEATKPRPGEALGLAAVAAATVLFWWPLTDRLDLPKQAVLVVGAGLLVALIGLRPERLAIDLWTFALSLAPVVSMVLARTETSARVEGWASWAAAIAIVVVARRVRVEELIRTLGLLGVGLAAMAWLQAMGLPLFNEGLTGFEGRRVVGTLGGPGHLGWTLALIAPFVGVATMRGLTSTTERGAWRRWAWSVGLAAVIGALTLSGSRTGWVMAAAGAPIWVRRRHLLALTVVTAVGVGAALGVDALTGRAGLERRVSDLASSTGTARGRLYIWRVYRASATELVGLGHGPEGFQRQWPAWQRSFLSQHSSAASFRSDLRHAHADAVEVLCDLGLPGLLLGLVVLALALSRGPPRTGVAQAVLVSALVGGIAAPVLFFAPTLCLAALSLGLRLGPVARPLARGAIALVFLSVVLAAVPLGVRLLSEVERSHATWARGEGQLEEADSSARNATSFDDRNPRAWIERGLVCERIGDGRCAREAFERAARDLPSDAVLTRVGPASAP